MAVRLFLALIMTVFSISQSLLNGDPATDHTPAWSPAGDRIAYLRNVASTAEIYRVNMDGSNQTKLTTAANASSPSWSPDGSKIAYISNGSEIHIMNADGSDDRKIPVNVSINAYRPPVWSPDSTKIIYTSAFDINIVNVDGGGPIHYADGLALENPKWSPDGKWIAFIRPWESSIMLMPAEGHSPSLLAHRLQIYDFVWSPDGQKIAFPYTTKTLREIGMVNVSDKAFTRLTDTTNFEEELAWSPDGSKLAFTSNDGIYTMNPDGSQRNRLGGTQAQDSRPLWSPDGGRIFYFRNESSETRIYSMEADGNSPVFHTSVPWSNSALSPDLSQISYVSFQAGYDELYVMPASGGVSTKVSAKLLVSDYAWSPDGQRIALLAQESTDSQLKAFYLMDSGGNNLTKLTSTASAGMESSPVWSPDGAKIAFSGNGIFLIDVEDDTLTKLTHSDLFYTSPVWSPDGRSLAFLGRNGLNILDLESGQQDVISPANSDFAYNLVWSPRGDKLAFVVLTICCNLSTNARGELPAAAEDGGRTTVPSASSTSIHIINADGSDQRVLAQGTAPVWSPSGKYLLYNDDSRGISIMNASTNQVTLTGVYFDGTPAWSPDERSIVFGSNADLYLLHLTSGQ